MVEVDLETNTLAVLIAGLYCVNHNTNALAIPQSVYLQIAEKLEYFLPRWDYSKITFEEWINTHLLIYPKVLIDEGELKELRESTLYWEQSNGNAILIVSMDIGVIND